MEIGKRNKGNVYEFVFTRIHWSFCAIFNSRTESMGDYFNFIRVISHTPKKKLIKISNRLWCSSQSSVKPCLHIRMRNDSSSTIEVFTTNMVTLRKSLNTIK